MCKTYADKRKAGSAHNETGRFAGDISRAEPFEGTPGTQEVSVPSCRQDNPLSESGMGNGFDVYQVAVGTCVPYGDH
jgi:hypothetical protein